MKASSDLRSALRAIDRRSYPAYKSLAGGYAFGRYVLSIDHVQGDPFAAPSRLSVAVDRKTAGFPEQYLSARTSRTALADYLLRRFYRQAEQFSFRAKGSGKSGLITVSRCGQGARLDVMACSRQADSIASRRSPARHLCSGPAASRRRRWAVRRLFRP